MTCKEAIEYIYSFRKMQKSSSHERIEKLLSLFGAPHKKLKFIHVAGTNGKGSFSGAMSSVLTHAGYRTGLFTSPYVISFGERIQIDGKYIDDDSLCGITAEIREKTEALPEEMKPTVFEFITVLAFIYYEREGCDIVVLEAGIGGEHDSTNVIPSSVASVIMSVSLDHTEMLGDTVEKIAEEKSGIIRAGGITVSYPADSEERFFKGQNESALEVIRDRAEKEGSAFYCPDIKELSVLKSGISGTEFTYKHLRLRTALQGDHQVANMITVAECALALKEKGERITDEDIEKGIAAFTVPCRMETVSEKPLIILDGGHNEGCMLALRAMAEKHLKGKKITVLMASMRDKDYRKSIEIILPLCENAVFTRTDEIRGESPGVLAECGRQHCKNVFFCDEVQEAYKKALSLTGEKDALLCCGSFYLVSDIRKIIFTD
ncbi:MAG: bifunctional folylpolyglutamate synthase/dihydrofolate synthase [Clostridia bacterium]|nr:bifunctional folylpolyglutamate synthase/dihydrofolate synthase [Clostridia bacterium]